MFNRFILTCLFIVIVFSVNAKNYTPKTSLSAKPFVHAKYTLNAKKIVVLGYVRNTLAYQLQTIDKKDIAIVKYKNTEVTYMPIFEAKKIKIKNKKLN